MRKRLHKAADILANLLEGPEDADPSTVADITNNLEKLNIDDLACLVDVSELFMRVLLGSFAAKIRRRGPIN